MLSNLGQKRTLKSNSTQTFDDGNNFSELEDGDSTIDPSGSDGESLTSSDGKRRFRRAANKVRIFSESVDYSHVKSKVDVAALSALNLSPQTVLHCCMYFFPNLFLRKQQNGLKLRDLLRLTESSRIGYVTLSDDVKTLRKSPI